MPIALPGQNVPVLLYSLRVQNRPNAKAILDLYRLTSRIFVGIYYGFYIYL